jgi:hypothetical protein
MQYVFKSDHTFFATHLYRNINSLTSGCLDQQQWESLLDQVKNEMSGPVKHIICLTSYYPKLLLNIFRGGGGGGGIRGGLVLLKFTQ